MNLSFTYFYNRSFLFFTSILLAGCQLTSHVSLDQKPREASTRLTFIDISRFDSDLQSALISPEADVSVAFYDKVSPNNTPERLQKWLSAVEKNGGIVQIEPPPGELVSRDPLSLVGLLGSLWSSIKMGVDLNQNRILQSTTGHDAVISLGRNPKGEVVISKVTFKRKAQQ